MSKYYFVFASFDTRSLHKQIPDRNPSADRFL